MTVIRRKTRRKPYGYVGRNVPGPGHSQGKSLAAVGEVVPRLHCGMEAQ